MDHTLLFDINETYNCFLKKKKKKKKKRRSFRRLHTVTWIEIKRILVFDEQTSCMKPDLHVSINIDAVEIKGL
jgi:hypothetical protein